MAEIISRDLLKELFNTEQERAPGYHVSGSINRILRAINPVKYSDDRDVPYSYFALGHATEQAIVDALEVEHPGRYHRVGQIELDGMTGSPDLLDIGNGRACPRCDQHCPAILDVKLTKQSARKLLDLDEGWMEKYWWQIMAYCHMMGGIHRGQVLLIFINGDYRSGIDPVGVVVEETFSDEVLLDNWEMILRNKGEPE